MCVIGGNQTRNWEFKGRIYQKINRIGFTLEINKEDAWMKRYNELVQYKRETGNCNIFVLHVEYC